MSETTAQDPYIGPGSAQMESGPSPFTEQTVRAWRVEIDGLTEAAKMELMPSREVSLCITSLQKSKAWLGETLKAIGTANPYPNSSNPENKTIEPQAEHGAETRPTYVEYPTQVERVKAMRGSVQKVLDSMEAMPYGPGILVKGLSMQNLIEAKHWLGWELDRIKSQQETDKGGMAQGPSLPKSLY